jgi:hypothetical protein
MEGVLNPHFFVFIISELVTESIFCYECLETKKSLQKATLFQSNPNRMALAVGRRTIGTAYASYLNVHFTRNDTVTPEMEYASDVFLLFLHRGFTALVAMKVLVY